MMTTLFTVIEFLALILFSPGNSGYRDIDVLEYRFTVELSDTSDLISGAADLSLAFIKSTKSFTLDFDNPDSTGKGMTVVSVAGKEVAGGWEHSRNKLLIRLKKEAEAGERISLSIKWKGIPSDGLIISKNKYGRRTFFADHWPDRASAYLPVNDHPSDKAAVYFLVKAPSHYRVVASGDRVSVNETGGGYTVTGWSEKTPLPVKVMAFAAADFEVDTSAVLGTTVVTSWVFPENRSEGFSDYAIAEKPLRYYSELIGPYPFSKLANVQSKTIFGGLENAGCIFYSENSVTGKGRAESLIAHEIAHQWFGNSVTESDWRHIWLSEGFATYLTAMYLEEIYGEERMVSTMISARRRVLALSQNWKRPVIDTAYSNPMELLNANSYQKGAWVLHMLRNRVGAATFEKGLKLFYSRFRDRNASTADFETVMEEVSGSELSGFFRQWLETPGEPAIKISVRNEPGGEPTIYIEQIGEHIFEFPLDLKIRGKSGEKTLTVPVNGKITEVRAAVGEVQEVVADPGVKLLFRELR